MNISGLLWQLTEVSRVILIFVVEDVPVRDIGLDALEGKANLLLIIYLLSSIFSVSALGYLCVCVCVCVCVCMPQSLPILWTTEGFINEQSSNMNCTYAGPET